MIKKILSLLLLSSLISVPLLAQETPEVPEKTPEELLKELHKLMEETSKEMEKSEKGLADASRDKIKDDVVAEIVKKFREDLKAGNVDSIPEGVRSFLKENKEDLAEKLGVSEEDIEKASDSKDDELEEFVKANSEKLAEVLENDLSIKELSIRQSMVENKLEKILESQEETSNKIDTSLDAALEKAHELSGGGGGKSNNVDNDPNKKPNDGKPPEEGSTQSKPDQKSPEEGSTQGGDAVGTGEDLPPPENTIDKGGWQSEANKKVSDGGNSSDDHREPSKYKGFWRAWAKAMQKKIEGEKK